MADLWLGIQQWGGALLLLAEPLIGWSEEASAFGQWLSTHVPALFGDLPLLVPGRPR
jgi:hypothetical protein